MRFRLKSTHYRDGEVRVMYMTQPNGMFEDSPAPSAITFDKVGMDDILEHAIKFWFGNTGHYNYEPEEVEDE